MRFHHLLWHLTRDRGWWNGLDQGNRENLIRAGWQALRFFGTPGSGIDFLGMHRQMIETTNVALDQANDSDWQKVVGWDPIPWSDSDPDWPVPEWQNEPPAWSTEEDWERRTNDANGARSSDTVAAMRQTANLVRDENILRGLTLDSLGLFLEGDLHGWMHIRWAGAPPEEVRDTSVQNDWLADPWSSHVNKVFWKLHGWIDDRIGDWEKATGLTADLSEAWAGPVSSLSHMAHAGRLDQSTVRSESSPQTIFGKRQRENSPE